jgi:hypothetical protein
LRLALVDHGNKQQKKNQKKTTYAKILQIASKEYCAMDHERVDSDVVAGILMACLSKSDPRCGLSGEQCSLLSKLYVANPTVSGIPYV